VAPVRFLLNGTPRTEDRVPPTTTVLDYLRTVARLTGVKEGCAEGDCGACTIVLGRAEGGRMHYRAVNSCLMMLPQLDGAAVLTVEGLAPPDGPLHPVQQAMIESDATQCGFCTPGFVMSIFALAQEDAPMSEDDIHEALAGNLCRCTGYRSIVAACRRVAGRTEAPRIDVAAVPASPRCTRYEVDGQRFLAPESLDELLALRAAHPEALLLAGGTDLGLLVSKERRKLPLVIATANVPALRRIEHGPDSLILGAAVTYTEALPHLEAAFPAFARLVRRIGSRQIRNLGTLGGNLGTASPIGDTLPCLVALGAEVLLRSQIGARTVPIEDFLLGYRKTALQPTEIIEAIRIPRLAPGQRLFAYKLSKRFDQDISSVAAAYRLTVEDGIVRELRAAYGGMADRVKRARAVEAALVGRPWTAATLAEIDRAVAEDFTPLSDHRAGAAYRLRAAANLLRRLQLESTGAALSRLEAL